MRAIQFLLVVVVVVSFSWLFASVVVGFWGILCRNSCVWLCSRQEREKNPRRRRSYWLGSAGRRAREFELNGIRIRIFLEDVTAIAWCTRDTSLANILLGRILVFCSVWKVKLCCFGSYICLQ